MSDQTGTRERDRLDGVAEPAGAGGAPADPGPTGRHEHPPPPPPPPPPLAAGPRAGGPVRDPVSVDGVDDAASGSEDTAGMHRGPTVDGEQDDTAPLDDPLGPAPTDARMPAAEPVPTAAIRRDGPPPAEPPSPTRAGAGRPASVMREEPPTVELSPDEPPGAVPGGGTQPAPTTAEAGAAGAAGADDDAGTPTLDEAELTARWQRVQATFVDEPRRAVEEADALVEETMRKLSEILAAERRSLVDTWRDGGDGSASVTEELRLALRRYRDLFQRMLAA